MKKNTQKNRQSIPEGFTLKLALADALPVLFFIGSVAAAAARVHSLLFTVGGIVVIAAGAGKVLWKLIIAVRKRNVGILDRQLRYTMPSGFALILLSFIIDRSAWEASGLIGVVTTLPSAAFFFAGIAGMGCMGYFAGHFDRENARKNRIEQGTNALAQLCILLSLIFC